MNRMATRHRLRVAVTAAVFFIVVVLAAASGHSEPFYKNKTLRLIVATKPGGGYDTYARLLAPRLEHYLPGITVVVQNVPGAGHIIGANKIFTSDPDGLTFGTFNKGLILAQLTGLKGVAFDLRRMSWLGTPATEPRVFIVSSASPFRSIDDIRRSKQACILPSSGISSESHLNGLVLAKIFGLNNIRLVTGYMGKEDEMAMLRGEVHGTFASADSVSQVLKRGEAVPVLVIGSHRLEEYPQVPLLTEIAPPDQKTLVDLMTALSLLGRPYAGPPGIPEDRMEILLHAFERSWKDPALLRESKKIGRPIDFVDGKTLAELIKNTMEQPPEVIQMLKEASVKN